MVGSAHKDKIGGSSRLARRNSATRRLLNAVVITLLTLKAQSANAEPAGALHKTDAPPNASLQRAIEQQAASITGNVTDADGKAVSAARVTLTELGLEVVTNTDGHYAFSPLPPGRYTLVARKVGYQSPASAIATAGATAPYNFVLKQSSQRLEPVTVTANASPTDASASSRSIGVLQQDALRNDASISLAHSLVALPGVRSVSTGLQIGKPMIRGLFGARVLTLEDGMRLEDYSWSEEDAPSIDARLAERVEVIRGPASVLYGSDALGGVINVIPEALPTTSIGSRNHHTSVEAYGASNNLEGGASARVEGANGRVGWRLSGTGRLGNSIHTPAGEIEHTGFFAATFQGAVGIRGDRSNTTLRVTHFGGEFKLLEADGPDTKALSATVTGTSSLLAEKEEEGEDEGPERKLLDDRVQLVHEHVLGALRLEAKAQYQRHSLIEESDDCLPAPGQSSCTATAAEAAKDRKAFDLLLNTTTVDVLAHHATGERLSGTFGLNGMYQSNDSRGPIFLVPSATISSVGAYAVEQLRAGIATFEGSARADHRSLDADANSQIFLAAKDSRSWNAATFNGGVVVQVLPAIALVGNIGTGWRAPTLFDLYSNGPHLAEARYEIGDVTLQREYDVTGEGGVRLTASRGRIDATAFQSTIDHYIYTAPTGQQMSGLPLFRHVQADARFRGVEASGALDVAAPFSIDARFDYVRADNTMTGNPLPLIPPARGAFGARYRVFGTHAVQNFSVRGEVESVAKQTRLDANDVPTGSYTLVNFSASAEHDIAGRQLRFDLRVQNAGNVAYRDFLSRYKQFALDPGRNIALRVSTGW